MVSEIGDFIAGQGSPQFSDVVGGKEVLVVQNEGLVELDDLVNPVQGALLSGEAVVLDGEHPGHALKTLQQNLQAGEGNVPVAGLGHRDGVEASSEPVLQALQGPIVLAMGQAGQLDGPAHVGGIGGRGGQLVDPVVTPLHQGCRHQGESAAHQVDRDDVQALALVGGELPEVGAQQVRQRGRRVDALVPAPKRLTDGGLHDRWSDHGNGEILGGQQRFSQALGEGVDIGPAPVLGSLDPEFDSAIANPAGALLANQA